MLIRLLFAVSGGLAGALIGGTLLAMAGAQVLPRFVAEAHPGAAAMSGAQIGSIAGLVLGTGTGLWLIFRDEGRWAGTALTCLWVGVLLVIGCLGFVAFS